MVNRNRIVNEQDFHDKKADGLIENQDFYQLDITNDIRETIFTQMGKLNNKIVLDYGCGSGWMSVELAKKGGKIIGIDLSSQLLRNARDGAKRNRLNDQIFFCQMNGEELAFKDCKLDIIIGNAILHHLDLQNAMEQLYSVLKKDGVAYFVEPLGYNPFINLYRKFTPNKRTIDEKPFRIKEINLIKEKFPNYRLDYFYFISLISFFWVFVIKNDAIFIKTLKILKKVDKVLLKILPFLKRFCWLILIKLQK